jgi:hypothetical protein
VSPESIGVCRGIESVDIRGGVEIVVERVEVAEYFCLYVRDNRGIDERELLVLPKESFRRGKPVRRERVDVNPRILVESIDKSTAAECPACVVRPFNVSASTSSTITSSGRSGESIPLAVQVSRTIVAKIEARQSPRTRSRGSRGAVSRVAPH